MTPYRSKLKLKEWYFTIYTFLRFNTSIRQNEAGLDVSYRTLRVRVEEFARTFDAPSTTLSGPVKIDEVHVPAGLKGRERDQEPRSRGLPARGSDPYAGGKLIEFTTGVVIFIYLELNFIYGISMKEIKRKDILEEATSGRRSFIGALAGSVSLISSAKARGENGDDDDDEENNKDREYVWEKVNHNKSCQNIPPLKMLNRK